MTDDKTGMYSLDAFLPLFSHVEHLVRAFPDGKARLGMGEEAVREAAAGCARCALRARNEAERRLGERGKEAWFPVRVWLAEKLRALPFGAEVEEALPAPEENAAVLFSLRLDNLMLKTASGVATPEERDLLRVYAACLDLGDGEEQRLSARHCRSLLDEGAEEEAGGNARLLSRLPARAAALALAPAALGGMYCVYRVWLGSLLRDILRV